VLIGLNDDAALGAQKAFENAGLSADDVYISGSDGGPEALENLKDPGKGAFRVTAALDILSLGHDIVDNSIAAITGEGEPDSVTPARLAMRVSPPVSFQSTTRRKPLKPSENLP